MSQSKPPLLLRAKIWGPTQLVQVLLPSEEGPQEHLAVEWGLSLQVGVVLVQLAVEAEVARQLGVVEVRQLGVAVEDREKGALHMSETRHRMLYPQDTLRTDYTRVEVSGSFLKFLYRTSSVNLRESRQSPAYLR